MAPVSHPAWAFDRTPHGVRIMLATGRNHGLDPAVCLRDTGLTPAAVEDPDTQVAAEQELTVARNLLSALGDEPGLGVETGLRYTLGTAGILGFALLSSPTMREAIITGLRYIGLSSAFVQLTLTERGRVARLCMNDTDIPEDVREFLVERDIGAVIKIGTTLFGGRLPAIDFRPALHLSAPRRAALAQLLGGIDIDYSKSGNSLDIPSETLDAPLPAADPDTARICIRQCEELV
jgi:hypothetical protein